jgi:hypothetical protein
LSNGLGKLVLRRHLVLLKLLLMLLLHGHSWHWDHNGRGSNRRRLLEGVFLGASH